VSADYDRGFAAGQASRNAEFAALHRVADYWYYRACNPGAPSPEQKVVDSIIAGMEINEERKRKREELDAAEAALFNEARRLLSETDLDDVQIAVKVGLFAPIVTNIRAGVL
jgi:hypothetical protein